MVLLAVPVWLGACDDERHPAPDGRHVLTVRESFRPFAMPGDGGSGSAAVTVVLRSSWGRPLARLPASHPCGLLRRNLAERPIRWAPDRVDFATARSFLRATPYTLEC